MIGYYAHHLGRGHLQRAGCIRRHMSEPLTILTSASRTGDPQPALRVDLPRDDDEPLRGDPTAGGVLHWVPPLDSGLRSRMARITAWIDEHRPAAMVVDVSVEVALLCRLMGIPVVVVAMQGDRTDRAHRLAYDVADALLACWPSNVVAPTWPQAWESKARFVSAFSRFDALIDTEGRAPRSGGDRRVVLLLGAGGTEISRQDIAAAVGSSPGWSWEILGGPDSRWIADPWPVLRSADVVITHAGQNALAEVAAARTPAVVIPQQRPHGEQHATADVLEDAGLAVVRRRWPAPSEWLSVLNEAVSRDGRRWALWCPGDGAQRAAQLIESIARGRTDDAPAPCVPR